MKRCDISTPSFPPSLLPLNALSSCTFAYCCCHGRHQACWQRTIQVVFRPWRHVQHRAPGIAEASGPLSSLLDLHVGVEEGLKQGGRGSTGHGPPGCQGITQDTSNCASHKRSGLGGSSSVAVGLKIERGGEGGREDGEMSVKMSASSQGQNFQWNEQKGVRMRGRPIIWTAIFHLQGIVLFSSSPSCFSPLSPSPPPSPPPLPPSRRTWSCFMSAL